MKKEILIAGIAAVLLILVCGCTTQKETEEGGQVPAEKASLAIQVTDKWTETFDHVNITFSEVKIHQNISDDDNSSWVVINSTEKTVDLIELNLNNINETLGVAEIEVGNYSKLWIHVTNATGVLNATQQEVEIDVPSGWLKIQQLHLFNLSKGNNTIIIDIDLEKSIHTYHKGERYKFVPVISSLEQQHEHTKQWRHEGDTVPGENLPPEVDFLVNNTTLDSNKKVDVDADENITFDASTSYDPEGQDLTFEWNFDDDTNASGANVTHSFVDQSQPYHVTLVVSDGTNEVTETINVHINKGNGAQ